MADPRSLTSVSHVELPAYDAEVLAPRARDLAVVLVVWNEGDRLWKQLERMLPFRGLVDVVVSDKPSSDGSTERLELEARGVSTILRLGEAGGFSSSLRAGLAWSLDAGYSGIVIMNGSNKDDSGAIPLFVRALRDGADYVQGSRYLPGGSGVNTPPLRDLLIRGVHAPLFSALAGRRFTDPTNGFRAFSPRLLADVRVRPFRHAFAEYELEYYLAWAACHYGFRVTDVPVTRSYPSRGPTPTKIRGFRRHWQLFKPLVMLALRRY